MASNHSVRKNDSLCLSASFRLIEIDAHDIISSPAKIGNKDCFIFIPADKLDAPWH